MQIRLAFGLHIASEVEIPGSQPAGPNPSAGPPDLHVRCGPASMPPHGASSPQVGPYRYHANTLLFHAGSVARYLCDANASQITIEPSPQADPEAVTSLLIATALPALLWMRGDLMLHAAAVVLPGATQAIAFAAPSGFGKTHLLGRLLAEQCGLLAEDTLCLRPTPFHLVATGLPACLFQRVHGMPSSHRRRVPVPPLNQRTAAPLGALILLTAGADPTPRRLHGQDALAAVVASFHRPRVPRLIGRLPALLPQVARIVQTIPVYRWSPPAQGPLLPSLQLLASNDPPPTAASPQ